MIRKQAYDNMGSELAESIGKAVAETIESNSELKESFGQIFKEDKKTIYAVTRAIEIIGEAVRHIPVEIRNVYPAVPWQDMADMRNKVAHEYFGVDTQVIWATVTEDVPQLKKLIRGLIDKLPR